MMPQSEIATLVSVIIPCYNYGKYLGKAIESVMNQTYSNVEIIIVDDGSVDNTKQVADQYKNVVYHYQENKGLPASRNEGLRISNGDYVVFLDADDWLYPSALETNIQYLRNNELAAFVSGAYDAVSETPGKIMECTTEITENCFIHFLNHNYVGVPAAVMYRRRVLDEFLFDESLKSCEDYDLYLRISRNYSVIHHNHKIAAYRKHSSNMSLNFPVMLSTALAVLQRQKNTLATDKEKKAYRGGVVFWRKYYGRKLYEALLSGNAKLTPGNLNFLRLNNPKLLLKILIKYPFL